MSRAGRGCVFSLDYGISGVGQTRLIDRYIDGLSEPATLLYLGCGPDHLGNSATLSTDSCGMGVGRRLILGDINSAFLRAARKRVGRGKKGGRNRIRWLIFDAAALPLASDAVDVVACPGTLRRSPCTWSNDEVVRGPHCPHRCGSSAMRVSAGVETERLDACGKLVNTAAHRAI